MKKDIHPKYYPEAKVICSCGNTWTTGSTEPEIRTDVCSQCHPFFTGEQRIVDTAGQVDRFVKRLEAKQKFDEAEREREDAVVRAKEERRRRRRQVFESATEEAPAAEQTEEPEAASEEA